MSALRKVLPGILQKHCCILPDRNTESQCTLCGEPEECRRHGHSGRYPHQVSHRSHTQAEQVLCSSSFSATKGQDDLAQDT
uniref:uncharacterized protein LOC132691464 isoform X3 n=1 Tax=Panthera onca TaxID=9690 RepID=UPI00295501AE|nr:uncharacterized protein LOC132691464 isoform X3 [Panthera onca]